VDGFLISERVRFRPACEADGFPSQETATRRDPPMKYWHLTFSSDGRHPLFPSECLRRAALWAIARVKKCEILLFCIVDDHLHLVIRCEYNS